VPDYNKSLSVLREEWERCQRCELGTRREAVGGQFVFGEGKKGGILFLGEGPGRVEEEVGRPFIGKSGTEVLRRVIAKLGIEDYYITNIVSCRSARPRTYEDGTPVLTRSFNGQPGKIRYEDVKPNKDQVEACRPRLEEEIYLVDPIVIVAMGGQAVAPLTGRAVAITKERGEVEEVSIGGAGYHPALTAKKQAWARKQKGQIIMPMEQNRVRYLMIPTLHPAYVYRQHQNFEPGNPFEKFYGDIKLALKLYNRYMLEVHGVMPGELSAEIPYEILDEIAEENASYD
jgi:DNA polymerase